MAMKEKVKNTAKAVCPYLLLKSNYEIIRNQSVMNIPSNEYMSKVKTRARDGKIHPGERQTIFIVHEGWCPCLRDPARHEYICRPETRGID